MHNRLVEELLLTLYKVHVKLKIGNLLLQILWR
jgi:hypothetical protein